MHAVLTGRGSMNFYFFVIFLKTFVIGATSFSPSLCQPFFVRFPQYGHWKARSGMDFPHFGHFIVKYLLYSSILTQKFHTDSITPTHLKGNIRLSQDRLFLPSKKKMNLGQQVLFHYSGMLCQFSESWY